MGILIAFTKNDKAKVKLGGKTLSLLTLTVAIGKCLAERISEEKGGEFGRSRKCSSCLY